MRFTFLIVLNAICLTTLLGQTNSRYVYIDKFKDIAISEMERAGVPASIKLAQGILESNAGQSVLARRANNHFGVKCGGKWNGKTFYREDDDYDSNGQLIKSCFRSYRNAETSYIAHSDFLRANPRYDFLFRLNPYDYKRWAHGLKKAGYATSATYAQKLIKVIEEYDLNQYDRMNANDVIAGENAENSLEHEQGITRNNDIRLVLAKANETPQRIADRTRVKVMKILKYNENITDPNEQLERDARIYLQPKRNAFRGEKKYHYVQAGESMYDIAQLYGVKVDKLRKRNRIAEGREPAFGEKIKLRGFRVFKTDRVRTTKKKKTKPTIIAKPNPKPNTNTPEPNPEPVDIDDSVTNDEDDGLPSTGRRPVLTSETGERGEDFYPPKQNVPPVQTNTPINENPVVTPSPTQPSNPTPPPTTSTESFHTVAAGDTLYSISRRYGLSVQALMDLNNMTNTVIRKGQKLRVK